MKRKVSLLLVLVLLFSLFLVGCEQAPAPAETTAATTTAAATPAETTASGDSGIPAAIAAGGIKIAVIRNLTSDDHTKQFLEGAVSEGEAFGFKVDTMISDGDDAKFQDLVAQAINQGYDGLVISHGQAAYSYDMLKPAVDKGMKVVTFDTVIEKDGQTLPEITTTAQDDMELAKLSLDAIVELKKDSLPVKVIKLWYGPGVPPLDRREVIYKEYEAAGKIKTVENLGPTTLSDVRNDCLNKVAAVLPKYKVGDVDAIWGSWDEMAKGGYTALKDAGRNDIKLISIDVSNQDMELMRESDIWLGTAAVDPKLIGIVNMRILAKKIAGEETPKDVVLEAKYIAKADLKPETNMTNLNEVVQGWGKSDSFNEAWMDALRK